MVFDIKQVKRTLNPELPVRTLVHGPHKIGKSTFASQAPESIFIQTEDGLGAIDAQAFPLCVSWQDILACLTSLYNDDHKFKTVILDSADWAERLAHAQVCQDKNVKSIEDIGYGKGYSFAADLFKELLDGLDAIRKSKNMGIVILAHTEIKRFDDPQSDAYDRYQIKLQKGVAKLVQEWSDVIAFAQLDTICKIEKGKGFKEDRSRAITTGSRVLRLVGAPSYDAGNRYNLPETVGLNWADYQAALDAARKVG